MVEDSASASPPSSSKEFRPQESHSELSTELLSKEEQPQPKETQQIAPETLVTQTLQPMSENEPSDQELMSETETPELVKPETEPPNPVTLEKETPELKTPEPSPPQQAVTAETEPPEIEPPRQVASETETPEHVASEPEPQRHVDVSDWTEPEPPEAAVLEAAAAEPETELPELEQMNLGEAETEVSEPEQMILGEPETELPEPKQMILGEPETELPKPSPMILGEPETEPVTHKLTPTEPEQVEPAKPAAMASRSLAEMMDREEAEAAEEERPENSPAAEPPSSGEEGNKSTLQIPRSFGSFKEESNRISDLSESELSSLHELRQLVQEETAAGEDSGGISIWGIPLLKDDRSDVVLLKFLRARDFKAQEAYTMLRETLQWRKEFDIEKLTDENLGDDLDNVVFMQGHDREGHPVCYNVYGEFQNKELYQKTFSDEEKRNKFLRWRIQFLEKSIRKLDFTSDGVSTICQVNDLKNSPGPGKKELRLATKQAVELLQDNYPEFVSKQIFINVPWWYLALYKIISPFMTQRSKSKLVFTGPSRSAETLMKYIPPEQVPIQYGGLSVDNCDCNSEFSGDDTATEITVKPTTKQTVEIIIYEKCTIVWELRVLGWDVTYGAEFLPDNGEAYTVIIQKPRKMSQTDEPVVSQSFKVGELGKILLTIDNPTAKKKKLLYRFKVKPLCE